MIVDGIEQTLNDIDPNQIESIHILKDAAAASMYGSRGANGVIVIETKRGTTGEFKVNVNSWFAMNQPIDLPKFVNSVDFMRLRNEAWSIQGNLYYIRMKIYERLRMVNHQISIGLMRLWKGRHALIMQQLIFQEEQAWELLI